MSWVKKYIGIPFLEGGRTAGGCDCGGLVLLALKQECGIIAADFNDYGKAEFGNGKGMSRLGAGIESLMREWIVVDKPQPFDLLRFRYGRTPCHVGLWVGQGKFLHVEKDGLFARLTPLTDIVWGPRFIEFRRHEALMEGKP